MVLNAEGDNTALIPVAAANRSERNVAIVGVRLKRADQDLPGGLVVAHHRKRLHDIRAGRALHTAGT